MSTKKDQGKRFPKVWVISEKASQGQWPEKHRENTIKHPGKEKSK